MIDVMSLRRVSGAARKAVDAVGGLGPGEFGWTVLEQWSDVCALIADVEQALPDRIIFGADASGASRPAIVFSEELLRMAELSISKLTGMPLARRPDAEPASNGTPSVIVATSSEVERLSPLAERSDRAIRTLQARGLRVGLKDIANETGDQAASIGNHAIPELKKKRGLLSKPYRYEHSTAVENVR